MKTLKIAISVLLLAVPFSIANADTKDVNVVNTPTVNIGNTATNPIPITVQKIPAKNPFHASRVTSTSTYTFVEDSFGTVPDGMMANIESESINCDIPVGVTITNAFITTESDTTVSGGNILYIPLQKTGSTSTADSYSGAISYKLYAVHDPAKSGDVYFRVQTTETTVAGVIQCGVAVVGYTVPYP